jgi:hypothetical protein
MRIPLRSQKKRGPVEAIRKTADDAAKKVKSSDAYKATSNAAKKAPAPVKALPVVAGVGVAGAVAARKRRHHEETPEPAGAAAP